MAVLRGETIQYNSKGLGTTVKDFVVERYWRVASQLPALSLRDHLSTFVPVEPEPRRETHVVVKSEPRVRFSRRENVFRLRAYEPEPRLQMKSTLLEQQKQAAERPDLRISKYPFNLQRRVRVPAFSFR